MPPRALRPAIALLVLFLPVAGLADSPGPPPPNPPPAGPALPARPAPPAPPARPPSHGWQPYPCGSHGSGSSTSRAGCYHGNQPQVYLDANAVQALTATPRPVPAHKPTPHPKTGFPSPEVFSIDSSANAAH